MLVKQEKVGRRRVYELDHTQELQFGGNVYDMNNIIVRTPYLTIYERVKNKK